MKKILAALAVVVAIQKPVLAQFFKEQKFEVHGSDVTLSVHKRLGLFCIFVVIDEKEIFIFEGFTARQMENELVKLKNMFSEMTMEEFDWLVLDGC